MNAPFAPGSLVLLLLVALGLGLLSLPCALADQSKSNSAFLKGKAHYEKGSLKLARAFLLQAIRENPQNKRAQDYLRHVQASAKHGVRPASLETALKRATIREVKLEEVAIKDALAFVRESVAKATGGKLRPNLILKKPSESKITLDLADLPASEVLRYIAELSGHKIQYDPYAAIIYKPTVSATKTTPQKGAPPKRR